MNKIECVLFRHDLTRDFTVCASSLPQGETYEVEQWLSAYVRAGGSERPATSIRYVSEDGTAAILRRVRGQGDTRSDLCQVLVGPSNVLTHRAALAMRQWHGWNDGQWPPLPRVNREDIDVALNEARSRHQSQPRMINRFDLVAAVAALLREPDRPLSLSIASYDQGWAVDYLWALFDLINDLFRPPDPAFAWTFSTFEVNDDSNKPNPVRIAFLVPDAETNTNFGTVRSEVPLPAPAANGASNPDVRTAMTLVDRYHELGAFELRRWMAVKGIFIPEPVAERIQLLYKAFGHEEPLTDAQLLCRLWDANDDPASVLDEIRRRSESSPEDREEVRRLLLMHPGWLVRLCDAVPPEQADEAADTVVRFAIPAADLTSPGAIGEVSWVLMRLSGTPLDRALNRHLIANGAHGIIHFAAMHHYWARAGLKVPESAIRPEPKWTPPVASTNAGDRQWQPSTAAQRPAGSTPTVQHQQPVQQPVGAGATSMSQPQPSSQRSETAALRMRQAWESGRPTAVLMLAIIIVVILLVVVAIFR